MGYKEQISNLVVKYGKLALGVHITLSALNYGLCYLIVKYGMNNETIRKYISGLKKDKPNQQEQLPNQQEQLRNQQEQLPNQQEQQPGQSQGQQQQNLNQYAKNLGTGAIAYVLYKALMPVRIPITISVVGILAKLRK